jgi:hypothetical protein
MIVLPPLLAGCVQLTATRALPVTPATAVGASGVVKGVNAAETTEYDPVPPALTAATRKVYAVPFVNPVTVHDAVEETESVNVVQVVPSLEYCTT